MLENIFFWLQIIFAILIIIFVVMQPSKGSDLGSIAGGSSNNSNKAYIDPITKFTGFLLLGFLAFSFFVTYVDNDKKTSSVLQSVNLEEIIKDEKSKNNKFDNIFNEEKEGK